MRDSFSRVDAPTGPSLRRAHSLSKTPIPLGVEELKKALELCVRKTRWNIKRLADEPKSAAFAADGNYFAFKEGFFDIGNWTSSFFAGMALLAWRLTNEEHFIQQLQRLAPWYREKVFGRYQDTMHDLGFLYSLYSVALYKLTGDQQHREVGLRAAELLAARFSPRGGFIQAWGRMDERDSDYAGLAIIDCLMNLPLLYWASALIGDTQLYDIAITHANTTLRHFVREDDSVCHAFRFDPETGCAMRPDNYCGRAVGSHWARGTAWAIYGFALSHRYVGDPRYLEVALRLARRFVQNLDDEIVPLWDFKLPAGEKRLRDSSAAAIAICAFQELLKQVPGETVLATAKHAMLSRISSEQYLNFDESCPGVLREGEIGDGVGTARNAYTSWGDFYLMKALARELDRGTSL